ncbi:hypothetical protein [Sciscionella marina]|nr:hypothetical protein [Sciscionella marina]
MAIVRRDIVASGIPRTECRHTARCARCKRKLAPPPNDGVMCPKCARR